MNMPDHITITSAADIAVAVPYLVGYHPDRELVTIAYADDQIVFTGITSLEKLTHHGYAAVFGDMLRQREIRQVILTGYGPDATVTPVILDARDACTNLGIRIGEAMRIDEGCWWSYLAPGSPGTAIEQDTTTEATFIAAGRAPLTSPAAVSAQLEPETGTRAEAMVTAIVDTEQRVWQRREMGADDDLIAEGITIAQLLTDTGTLPDDAEVALLGALLTAPRIGVEVSMAAVVAIDATPAATSIPVWTALTRLLPESCRWQAAALTGFAAWRSGNGALARRAIDLSLAINNTDNGLAWNMSSILADGIAPFEIAKFTTDDLA